MRGNLMELTFTRKSHGAIFDYFARWVASSQRTLTVGVGCMVSSETEDMPKGTNSQLKLSTWSLELGAQVARLYDALPNAPTGAAVHHNSHVNSLTAVNELTSKEKFLDDVKVSRKTVTRYRKLKNYANGELTDLVVKVAEKETKAVTLNAAVIH